MAVMEVLSVIVAGVTSLVSGRLLIRLGRARGWIDHPDDEKLKAHRLAAVPLGGVAIWVGVILASVLMNRPDASLLAASVLLLALGLIDDRHPISPPLRLGVETVAGFILGAGRADTWLTAVLVAALVVIAVNAVNLFDGLDGLAGLSGLVAAIGVGALALVRGLSPAFGVTMAAALIGFLVWNWHPARLFLGDNGAYVLAIFLVSGIETVSPTTANLLVAVALLGVFLVDMAATLLRRALASQPLFSRDRMHLYDRMAQRGISIPVIATVAGALQLGFVAAVVVADLLLPNPVAVATLGLLGATVVLSLVKMLGATRSGYWADQ